MIDGRFFPFFPLAFGPSPPAADALVPPRPYRPEHPPPPIPTPFIYRVNGDLGCDIHERRAIAAEVFRPAA